MISLRHSRILLRGVMLLLFFFSIEQAWAGVYLYRAEGFFREGNTSEALKAFEKVRKIDPNNLRLLKGIALLEEKNALNAKEVSIYLRGMKAFEDYLNVMPYDGRAYLSLARLRLELAKRTGEKGFSPRDLEAVKKLLAEAKRRSPHDAGIRFEAGKIFLTQNIPLSPEEQATVLEDIRHAVELKFYLKKSPYVENPSPYLEQACELLWTRYADIALLRAVTPEDLVSYQTLSKFLKKKGLWKYLEAVDLRVRELEEKNYRELCGQGEAELLKGDFTRAFLAFRKAFWLRNWLYLRAKAGMLAAQEGRGLGWPEDVTPWKEKYPVTLKAILENEDEDLRLILPFLRTLVNKTNDPYLMGLYEYWMGNDQAAERELEKTKKSQVPRRLKAKIQSRLGNAKEAVLLLAPVLQEKTPDPRELQLLSTEAKKVGDFSSGEAADRRLLQAKEMILGAEAWETSNASSRDYFKAMPVFLLPGRVRFRIAVKNSCAACPAGEYVLFFLDGKELGGKFLEGSDWRSVVFDIQTEGGKHWLKAQRLSYEPEISVAKDLALDLGSVEVSAL